MKKFLTVLFLTGLLTASIEAAENSAKTAGTGKAILGISPHEKEITVRAVTADGSPVQVEGCTVTEFLSGEKTVLTATGTKVVLKGALIELFCYANKLTALDVRGLMALQELYCQNNMLTSLDVRELIGLRTLFCNDNRLTALDIRGLTALQNLYCNGNEIASLDVRGLTALQALHCDNNRLTSLNVQGLTALQLLVCSDNQLTALNVQGLPALQILDCSSNRLTSLDVHALTALKGLYCRDNKLTSLDVRELIGLRTLFCNDNRLTALNVRRLTALQELDCSSNAIASIDVRGLTGLRMLYCDNNRLTSLDVQGLTALQLLVCSDNQLTALNVQSLPALQALVFQHNRLEEDALIRILNSLPDRKTDEKGLAVFYTEEDNRSEGNYTDWNFSAGLQAAIKTARAKNWTLYKQVGGEDFEELEVTEEAERGTHSGSAAVPTDKTYTVKDIRFAMKPIAAVQGAVLGDNNMEDNQEHSVSLSAYYIGETEVTQERQV